MKRSLLVGIAGATIALGTVASASAAPLPLENPSAVADSGSSSLSSDAGSSAATSSIIGALVSVLPTGSTDGIGNAIGSAFDLTGRPLIALLCTLSAGGHCQLPI